MKTKSILCLLTTSFILSSLPVHAGLIADPLGLSDALDHCPLRPVVQGIESGLFGICGGMDDDQFRPVVLPLRRNDPLMQWAAMVAPAPAKPPVNSVVPLTDAQMLHVLATGSLPAASLYGEGGADSIDAGDGTDY